MVDVHPPGKAGIVLALDLHVEYGRKALRPYSTPWRQTLASLSARRGPNSAFGATRRSWKG